MIEGVYTFFGCIFGAISLVSLIVFLAELIDDGDFDIVPFLVTLAFAIIAIIAFDGNDIDSNIQAQYESQLYDCTKYKIDTVSYNKDGNPKEFKIVEIK